MKRRKIVLALFIALFAFAHFARAGEEVRQNKRARSLVGAPVNVDIAGAGSLPRNKALTMINASFADKTRSKRGGATDVFSRVWLFKFRYGITDRLEFSLTTPYINNKRSGNYKGPEYVEGFVDETVQFTVSPLQQFLGDPFTWSVTAAVLAPTGTVGKNHLPGAGVWGSRMATGVGAWFTPDFKIDMELVWTGPFARGNQNVRRGDKYQWNVNARYLFDWFDIGLESTLTKAESGDKSTPLGTVGLRNGYTDWFVGPSINVASDTLGMWAGVGVFLPVLQDIKGPASVENARYEFKVGKVW
jgi:hypothetical protein